MPQQYIDMRDRFIKQGLSKDDAQTKAAKIYNYLRGKHPSMQKLRNKPEKTKANG